MAYQLSLGKNNFLEQLYSQLETFLPKDFNKIPAIQQLEKMGFKLTSVVSYASNTEVKRYKPYQLRKFIHSEVLPRLLNEGIVDGSKVYHGDTEFCFKDKSSKKCAISITDIKIFEKNGSISIGIFKSGKLLDFEGKTLEQVYKYLEKPISQSILLEMKRKDT
ncbi:MAG: hypothetical protein QMD36_00535 [Candidatus Aenigmarchaeota archaeon]|nr:hypothetical protein [Candidatus Aenigmarchaeota archaeon]